MQMLQGYKTSRLRLYTLSYCQIAWQTRHASCNYPPQYVTLLSMQYLKHWWSSNGISVAVMCVDTQAIPSIWVLSYRKKVKLWCFNTELVRVYFLRFRQILGLGCSSSKLHNNCLSPRLSSSPWSRLESHLSSVFFLQFVDSAIGNLCYDSLR